VQTVENLHRFKHFCICRHVASVDIVSEPHHQETFRGNSLHLKFLEKFIYILFAHETRVATTTSNGGLTRVLLYLNKSTVLF
jgi:hypothetical protein